MDTISNILRTNWRLILFVLGVILTFALLFVFRGVLFPFVCGLVLAYLLHPVLSWLERKLPGHARWVSFKRISLIVLMFVAIFGFAGLLTFYVISGVVTSFLTLVQNAPQYFSEGLKAFQDWLQSFRQWLPPEIQGQVTEAIQEIGEALGNALRGVLTKGLSYIPATFTLALGFISLPIFLFYILKDSEKLSKAFYSAFPPRMARHVNGIVSVIDRVLGRWIRAQLVLSAIVAILCFIGLSALGIQFAPALAVFQGIMEFIPILGPWIGGAFGVIVTLATAPEKTIWVIVVYLAVQLLENTLLVPRIQGDYMRIHPAIILVLLPVGAYAAGFWGIVLVVPLVATIVEIYRYVRQNIGTEESQQLAG